MSENNRTTSRKPNTASVDAERARLRRNQRNSRARKQAYIQNLEKQWNECLRLGARATIEMQKEAKRVQEENRVLRTLLHNQGLDDAAIQRAIDAAKLPERSMDETQNSQDTSKSGASFNTCNFSPIPCLPALSRVETPQLPRGREDIVQPPAQHNCIPDLPNPKDVFNLEVNMNDQMYPDNFDFTEILSDNLMDFPSLIEGTEYNRTEFLSQDEYFAGSLNKPPEA
ncbi:uncharacterized protein F4812DRAFT_436257 [Daldinia caldariorum]|uniref:uncharacterized protein n=1 Tax=Daldinia caldariorum TaxID=326644 RepID=UPI00200752CB|nr:uncharacterized protein F4812DRAFT_436257 [Daldinia caldariorum]KAI1466202.1 hypothetical protein F4812DRAFT_436257 [Daldinia caldariorum]